MPRKAAKKPKKKSAEEQAAEEPSESEKKTGFPIVGVGGSAGGLEAMELFFKSCPAETGLAYVIISHLDPKHPSILAELLSRDTSMDVLEATDRIKVEPNKVYVMPPGKELIIVKGRLRVFQRQADNEPHMPIDQFLRSLAEDQDMNAIAVILSGNGTDGSFGLRHIKGNIGMAMVQDPATARYDNMPRSAIATGLVDYVLAPQDMPEQIMKYVKSLQERIAREKGRGVPADQEAVFKILNIVRTQTGHDFSLYKRNTIYRRIERRMNVHQIQTKQGYADFLRKNPSEVHVLFKEMLIQVTRFFRDPEAFDALKANLKDTVLTDKQSGTDLRVWCPGCSSGEEVFSLAIVLHELMVETGKHYNVQIFGTDIDEDAIDIARGGTYPNSVTADLTPERIEKYFTKDEDRLKVRKEIREMAIFAPQNAIRDPPFSRLDLITCRNLLIYFEPVLQRKLMETLTFALNPGGLLFLGTSESVDGFADDFDTLDSKYKVFQRRPYPQMPVTREPIAVPPRREEIPPTRAKVEKTLNVRATAEAVVLNEFSPPSIVVNSKDEIVYFHGRTGKYLEPSPGKASLTLQNMLKEDVRFAVMSALRESRGGDKKVIRRATRVTVNGDSSFLNIIVRPVTELKGVGGMLIVFQDIVIPKEVLKEHQELTLAPDKEAYIKELEKELSYTKESLQSTIEELETSNEELKSTNEELQSTNEELQSVAEESETAKEELHSLNEELMSVNSELEKRNQDLSSAASDWRNLLNSIDVVVVFLDSKMRIKRFTPQVEKIMNLLPTDVGRPIQDISLGLKYIDIVKDSTAALEKLSTKELEVQTTDGRWYALRIMPYRTVENVIDGVVITFTDIDGQKKAQEELQNLA
ncbi:MAG TPA: CheR family methyltransferase, partial [Methanomassiliicoccales archaeon]|nr:CheR family methyltransferase [Methanomassiliicoccales archaeon]